MDVRLNTDNNIEASDELAGRVGAAVRDALRHHTDRLTRVEAHLSDANSHKSGTDDKQCVLEARPAGQRPVAVRHNAATVELAIDGAAEKLGRALGRQFGRLDERAGPA